ncbi:MAG: hypothetical protein ACM309_10845 [Bacillota bacterium]
MEPGTMEARLIDACLALGHICVEEARWLDEPELRAAMVRHAIGFLGAAEGFLPPPRPGAKFAGADVCGRNHAPAEEA